MRSALPGYEIVEEGLRDLREGRETVNSLLVSMAVERLEQLGYSVPNPLSEPEIRLYRKLEEQFEHGAHSKYNAYRRRLSSFLRAASCVTSSTGSRKDRARIQPRPWRRP